MTGNDDRAEQTAIYDRMKHRLDMRKAPLRKIVRRERRPLTYAPASGVEAVYEVLECGHTLRPRHDIYGETSPARRRCLSCYREIPA